jgi:hypothetical protein
VDTARIMKTIYPQIQVIFGGPEVGPVGPKYMNENHFIDVVINGEGEITFCELLSYYLGKGRIEEIKVLVTD